MDASSKSLKHGPTCEFSRHSCVYTLTISNTNNPRTLCFICSRNSLTTFPDRDTIIEMMRLNPCDPMGQHTWLGSLLCRLKRYSDALFFAQVYMRDSVVNSGEIPPRGGTVFHAPEKKLLPQADEERVSRYHGSLLYTAALASFKIWGDCPESCQYLRIASKANTNVLVKVLGRKSRPGMLAAYASVPHNS